MSDETAMCAPPTKAEGLPYSVCHICFELTPQLAYAAPLQEWKKKAPDEKAVYLALVDVFKGISTKKPWKKKRIKTRILRKLENRINSPLRILVSQHGLDSISESARILSTDGIFQSIEKAKSRWPELFTQNFGLHPAKEASSAEVMPAQGSGVHDTVRVGDTTAVCGACSKTSSGKNGIRGVRITTKLTHGTDLMDTHPAFLTDFNFTMQYQLMVQLQTYLEQMCFVFGRKVMPDIMDKNGWECTELVDINQWIQLFRAQKCFLGTDAGISTKSVEKIFQSLANVRRTTVDRNRLDLKGIEQTFANAETFGKLLGDTMHLDKIFHLRSKIQEESEKLMVKTRALESKLEATGSKIEKERAVLDELETFAISEAKWQSKKYQDLAAEELKKVLVFMDYPMVTPIGTDDESVADLSGVDTGSN